MTDIDPGKCEHMCMFSEIYQYKIFLLFIMVKLRTSPRTNDVWFMAYGDYYIFCRIMLHTQKGEKMYQNELQFRSSIGTKGTP